MTRPGAIKFDRIPQNYKIIEKKEDLPSPVNGVVTLEDMTSYYIFGTIDLEGDRLLAGGTCAMFGTSPEVSILKSTGFDDTNGAFLTSENTIACNFLAFHEFGDQQVLDIDGDKFGNGNTPALDWFGINFLNCGNIGSIKNVGNFIANTFGLLSSCGLTFSGSVGTISFQDSIFTCFDNDTILHIDSAAVISRRFRITYSAFVVTGTGIGIDFDVAASVPNEAYILDTINFSGGSSTYLSGVPDTDNKALFSGCRGIPNTAAIGEMYMNDNTSTVDPTTADTFVKIPGTTTAGPNIEQFTHTSNRLTYSGSLTSLFEVSASISAQTDTQTTYSFRIAKNGTTSSAGQMKMRQRSNVGVSNIAVQDVFELSTGDYIEVFAAADLSNEIISVLDMNVLVRKLKE